MVTALFNMKINYFSFQSLWYFYSWPPEPGIVIGFTVGSWTIFSILTNHSLPWWVHMPAESIYALNQIKSQTYLAGSSNLAPTQGEKK